MNCIEKPTINLIGAGKVGKALAKRIILHQCGTIQAVCNATLQSAKQAVACLGQGYAAKIDELPPAQITLITTPDDQIAQCCRQLAQTKTLVHGAYVIHCSGAWNVDILTPAQQQGALVASVHPLQSITEDTLQQFDQGTYCAIEGDLAVIPPLQDFFTALGFIPFVLETSQKVAYHAAAVFASNYLVTLAEQALLCLKEAQIESPLAIELITVLMQQTLNNLKKEKIPAHILTGPIQRGDKQTIAKHLAVLPEGLRNVYQQLGQKTIAIAALPTSKAQEIEALLTSSFTSKK